MNANPLQVSWLLDNLNGRCKRSLLSLAFFEANTGSDFEIGEFAVDDDIVVKVDFATISGAQDSATVLAVELGNNCAHLLIRVVFDFVTLALHSLAQLTSRSIKCLTNYGI